MEITGHENEKILPLEKKLDELEGSWASEKEMIVSDFNGCKGMIRLPSEKAKHYHEKRTKHILH